MHTRADCQFSTFIRISLTSTAALALLAWIRKRHVESACFEPSHYTGTSVDIEGRHWQVYHSVAMLEANSIKYSVVAVLTMRITRGDGVGATIKLQEKAKIGKNTT